MRRTRAPAILFMGVFLLGGCDRRWPASMEDQPAVQAVWAPRPAPAGAVPVGGVVTLDDREDAEDLRNPFPASAPKEREALFSNHCASCHGREGHGAGKLATKFPPAPDLRYVTICRHTDGYIYGTITAGGKAMPNMREGLTTRQRWALVERVRDIQRDGCVTAAGVQTAPAAPGEAAP